MDDFDDLDRYDGDTGHDMRGDYTNHEYTGNGPEPQPVHAWGAGCSALFALIFLTIPILVFGFRASAQKAYTTSAPCPNNVKVYVTDKACRKGHRMSIPESQSSGRNADSRTN